MRFVKLEEEQPNTNMIESNPSGKTKDGLLDWAEKLLLNSSPHPATNMAGQEWDRDINRWRVQKHALVNPEANGPTADEILAMDKDEREADQLTAKLRKAAAKDWHFRVRQSDIDGKWLAEVSPRVCLMWFWVFDDWNYLGENGLLVSRVKRCNSKREALELVEAFYIRRGL